MAPINQLTYYTFNFDTNVPHQQFLRNLRLFRIQREYQNKLLFVYSSYYGNDTMNFLYCINSSLLGRALCKVADSDYKHKICSDDEPHPTEEHPIKYYVVPAPQSFTMRTGVWQLFIKYSDEPSDENMWLFNSEEEAANFFIRTQDSKHNEGYIIQHYFDFNHRDLSATHFLNLKDFEPRARDIINGFVEPINHTQSANYSTHMMLNSIFL